MKFPLLSENIAGPRRTKIQNVMNTSSSDHSEEVLCVVIPYYIQLKMYMYCLDIKFISISLKHRL